ncbi:hypothetical protein OA381_05100 [Rhodospirillaceae bacterium]|nr:hypothetical protein [Rhodospirillaceae bacterium]
MELNTKSDDLLIGVVGGGAMGQGIVQVSLEGGMKVVLSPGVVMKLKMQFLGD